MNTYDTGKLFLHFAESVILLTYQAHTEYTTSTVLTGIRRLMIVARANLTGCFQRYHLCQQITGTVIPQVNI